MILTLIFQVSAIHLSLPSQPESTIVVVWTTPDSTPSFVQYGLTTGYGHQAEGRTFYSPSYGQYIHEVRITDLSPDTLYHYRCGHPPKWSSDRTFLSGKPKGESGFSFVVYGDTRTDTTSRRRIRDVILSHLGQIRFILHCGDLVEVGSNRDLWEAFLIQMDTLFSRSPVMVTVGNHDEYGGLENYLDLFVLPEGSGTERFYSFTYGNLHILSLYDPRPESRIKPTDPQYHWLTSDLEAASNDPDIDWIILFFHVPPYSAGYGYQYQREDITPICDNFGIDLVCSGHTHNYERSYLLFKGEITDSGPEYNGDLDGTVYIVTGGGGAPLSSAHYDWWTAYAKECYHFLLIEVSESKLRVAVIGDSNQLIDSWSIKKSVAISGEKSLRRTRKVGKNSLFDPLGRRIEKRGPLPSGIYFLIIERDGKRHTEKLLILH
ncbi:hypothetical protein DRP53_08270 [candidate division WOR-3 bacterium]|uniref:Metallophosphoesterase family protein n=1 Tax=candidate division WOR-3 bacterium TaxID=2052148 RepID=A0A660SHE6_UNCW3|nr:MAG: hypothetical protein DRP53_08270 [candidate division WOR-3 bacterium]